MSRILSLEGQLASIRDTLRMMCDRVFMGLEAISHHLVKPNSEILIKIIVLDDEVDALEQDLDEYILTVLATQQPMAAELRFVYASAKIAQFIERIGDAVKSLAKQLAGRESTTHQASIQKMFIATLDIYDRVYKSMFYGDTSLIIDIHQMDDQVDRMQRELLQESKKMLHSFLAHEDVDNALLLGNIANKLEKIADFCCNWAEQVDYAQNGIVRRKISKRKHRILVLDAHNGLLASIVANFIQSSAGKLCSCGVVLRKLPAETTNESVLDHIEQLSGHGLVPELFPLVKLEEASWSRVLLLITLGPVKLTNTESDSVSFKVAKYNWPEIQWDGVSLTEDVVTKIKNRAIGLANLLARTGID